MIYKITAALIFWGLFMFIAFNSLKPIATPFENVSHALEQANGN